MAYTFMEAIERLGRHVLGTAFKHAESALTFTDITTNDVSTSKHGFTPKAPNDTMQYLRGDASWSSDPMLMTGFHRFRFEPTTGNTPPNAVNVGTGATALNASRGIVMVTGVTNPSSCSLRLNASEGGTAAVGDAISKLRRLEIQGYIADTFASANSFFYLTDESVDIIPSGTARHFGIKNLNGTISFTTADGTTEQTTAITGSFTANKNAAIKITFDGTTAKCYVDGTLVATHATNVPAAGGAAVMRVFINNNASANSRNLRLYVIDALMAD